LVPSQGKCHVSPWRPDGGSVVPSQASQWHHPMSLGGIASNGPNSLAEEGGPRSSSGDAFATGRAADAASNGSGDASPDIFKESAAASDCDAARAKAIAELSQKVVQLTKVIVFLHTRSDGHDARCSEFRCTGEEETRRIAAAAADYVNEQQRHRSNATSWRNRQLEVHTEQHAVRHTEAEQALCRLQTSLDRHDETARTSFTRADTERTTAILELRHRAERLRTELGAAEGRAKSDRQWLARQLAGEATRERQRLDQEFDEECTQLRVAHATEMEELRASREASLEASREELAESRAMAMEAAETELANAVGLQEQTLAAERQRLEERNSEASNKLEAARRVAAVADDECAARQRRLDDFSRELQECKRQSQLLAADVDAAHSRKVDAEAGIRDLRRQRSSLEKALSGTVGAPNTERAVAGLAEDVRSAKARLEALKKEEGRTQRLVEERRKGLQEGDRQVAVLARELAEERQRSDDLQRALLRLAHGS